MKESLTETSIEITCIIKCQYLCNRNEKIHTNVIIFEINYINCTNTKLGQMRSSIWPIFYAWPTCTEVLGFTAPAMDTLFQFSSIWQICLSTFRDTLFVFSPNLSVEALTPRGMMLGGRAFQRWLGSDEVRGWSPQDGIRAPWRRDTRVLSLL